MAFETSQHPLARHIEAGIRQMNAEARTGKRPEGHRMIYVVVPREEYRDESEQYGKRREAEENRAPEDVMIPLDRRATEYLLELVRMRISDSRVPMTDAARWFIDDVKSGRLEPDDLGHAHSQHLRTLKAVLAAAHQSTEVQETAEPQKSGRSPSRISAALNWLAGKETLPAGTPAKNGAKALKKTSVMAAERMLTGRPSAEDIRRITAHLTAAMKAQSTPGFVSAIFPNLATPRRAGKLLILRFNPVSA